MEVSYRREMNHNYMIIASPGESTDGYECRMLAGNGIEGLLRFRVRHQGEKKLFYYEITSKQPLSRLFEQKKITGTVIRRLLLDLAATLNKTEEYLLHEDQILLEPDYIYAEQDEFSVSLCMVPGYSSDFPSDFTKLLRFLLEKVDHHDRDGVVLAYHLYHESLKDNYGMKDLLKYLAKEDGPVFEKKSTSALDEGAESGWENDRGSGRDSGREDGREDGREGGRGDGREIGKGNVRGEAVIRDNYGENNCRKTKENGDEQRGKSGWKIREEGRVRDKRKISDGREILSRQRAKNGQSGSSAPKDGSGAYRIDGRILCEGLKAVSVTAGALAILWFLAGQEAFLRFGLLLAAVTLGLFYLKNRSLYIKSAVNTIADGAIADYAAGGNTVGNHTTGYHAAGGKGAEDRAAEDRAAGSSLKILNLMNGSGKMQALWNTRKEKTGGQIKAVDRAVPSRRDTGHEEAGIQAPAGGSWRIDFDDRQMEAPIGLNPVTAAETEGEKVETALLSDLSRETSIAVLESLSKDMDNIEIPYVPFIIGKRSDMTDYCLDHRTVSRLHLRIDKKEGVYIVTDLNSTNGTTVEGYQLQSNETVSIKSGDLICLAEIGYRFTANSS